MPANRLTLALSAGVGVTFTLVTWGISARLTTVLDAHCAHELVAVGRQVRAVAVGLMVEIDSRRAAQAASEGLESAFPGRWRWLQVEAGGSADLARLGAEAAARLERGEAITHVSDEGGQELVSVLTPLPRDHEGRRLVLELAAPLAELQEVRDRAIQELWVGAAAVVVLTALVSALLGHVLVARPLRRIQRFVQGLAAGDRATRLPANGGKEVVALESVLNQLADCLAAAEREVGERTRAEARATDELRRSERLATVGGLAAGMAHELGTPLNVILIRSRAIERAAAEVDQPSANQTEAGRHAGIIAAQAERLTKLVRELLDFSRRRPPRREAIDPGSVCRAVAQLLEARARTAEVAVRVEVGDPLSTALADGSQMEQVLTNLVLNAIQASPGGSEVLVRCANDRARPPADWERPGASPGPESRPQDVVRIDVIDHGAGIPRENLPRIFEPFFTTKPPGEGTGLGLSVAWGIVREHGGWLEVESRECEGSRFSVLLPGGPGPTGDGAERRA